MYDNEVEFSDPLWQRLAKNVAFYYSILSRNRICILSITLTMIALTALGMSISDKYLSFRILAKTRSFCRFLDSRMFATCSDDKTVALWDTRNLKSRIRVLNGHENWVKNVEYSKDEKLLVTSGFDGSIFTWDINR